MLHPQEIQANRGISRGPGSNVLDAVVYWPKDSSTPSTQNKSLSSGKLDSWTVEGSATVLGADQMIHLRQKVNVEGIKQNFIDLIACDTIAI